MNLPNDPVILMSYLNTKLRDEYSSLEELGKSMQIDIDEVQAKIATIGYSYHPEQNQFKPK